MSGVSVSINARARTLIREFVRNGKAPVAELQNKLAELCGHAAIACTRQLFVRASPIAAIPGSDGAGARTRWRFAARSHPYALAWFVQMELAPQNAGAPSDPYTVLDIAEATDPGTVIASANVHYGSSDGSYPDVPWNLGGGLAQLLDGGAAWEVPANTDLVGHFYDVNYGRMFAACVWEVSLQPDTDDGFASIGQGLGSPVYDLDREDPLVMARSIFMKASAPLWHWGSESDATAPDLEGEDPIEYEFVVEPDGSSTVNNGTTWSGSLATSSVVGNQTDAEFTARLFITGTTTTLTPSTVNLDGWSESGWTAAGSAWVNTFTRATVADSSTYDIQIDVFVNGVGTLDVWTNHASDGDPFTDQLPAATGTSFIVTIVPA